MFDATNAMERLSASPGLEIELAMEEKRRS